MYSVTVTGTSGDYTCKLIFQTQCECDKELVNIAAFGARVPLVGLVADLLKNIAIGSLKNMTTPSSSALNDLHHQY